MRRKIPSTAALAAFEAAARHQSFTLAADELSLTQSAVGRQIANLEDFVGVKLFRRTRRGVALTTAGLQYSRTVRQRLDEVERDTLALMSHGGGGSVELGVVPTFATHWLVPRLSGFSARHPGIQVNLHVRTRAFLFAESGLDAAIHASEGGWPGTRADLLMPEPMAVVCAPALLGRRRQLSPGELAKLPLIQMTTRPYAWRGWFSQHGVAAPNDMAGLRVELFSMALQAALHRQGVALVPEYLVQDDVQRGLLATPVPRRHLSGLGYFLIYPENDAPRQELLLLREWLLEEAGRA